MSTQWKHTIEYSSAARVTTPQDTYGWGSALCKRTHAEKRGATLTTSTDTDGCEVGQILHLLFMSRQWFGVDHVCMVAIGSVVLFGRGHLVSLQTWSYHLITIPEVRIFKIQHIGRLHRSSWVADRYLYIITLPAEIFHQLHQSGILLASIEYSNREINVTVKLTVHLTHCKWSHYWLHQVHQKTL